VNTLTKYFPWAVVGVFALYAVGTMYPKRETYKEFNVSDFGAIPVLDGGRIKPLDSVARAAMLHISGRSDWEDPDGKTRPAILWLLEVLAAGDPNASPIADYAVFRIDNEQVLAELGLKEKEGLRYSWNEIIDPKDPKRERAEKFDRAYLAAQMKEEKKAAGQKVPEEERDLFHGKILELAGRLKTYEDLASRKKPTLIPSQKGSDKWLTLAQIDEAAGAAFADQAHDDVIAELQAEFMRRGENPSKFSLAKQEALGRMIEARTKARMRDYGESNRKAVSPAAAAFGDILKAYKDNKPKGFAEAIATYRSEYVDPVGLPDKTKFEHAFNAAAPFINAAIIYVFAGVLMTLSWLGWTEPLRKASLGLAGLALVLNIGGLLGRMYLMDRPLVFVTNLYSSALMIGCAAVVGCLIMERVFKNGVGLLVGVTLGAITVKIAHHLSTDGNDTLGMLQAVLDTNFWLASHVTTITLGYSATYLAGLLGIVYIVWGLFLTTLTKEKHLALGNMIYGVTCFAMLLSFVGTVLGGIWADQSWGRFWGWDPKENGAVLIVIWNALALHARWGGVVKQRGMAVLAVFGIMVTTWSWFGTNQLGVGLHAYGFSKTLAEGCKWTWIGSMVVIALGLVPLRYWRSFAPTGEPRPEPKPAAPAAASAPGAAASQPAKAAPAVAVNGRVHGHPQPTKKKAGKKR
jgi:ABC-type transport system involved in cytochrome c biogenesis permease subunit